MLPASQETQPRLVLQLLIVLSPPKPKERQGNTGWFKQKEPVLVKF